MRPSEHISNTVLITRVTNDTPEIKIPKTKNEVKLEEISTRTSCVRRSSTTDTHQGTFKPSQSENVTILTTLDPAMDEDSLQQISDLKACLDQLER